jgi:hypothetical protein
MLLLSVLLLSQLPADYAGHCGTGLFQPTAGTALAPMKLNRPAVLHGVGDQDTLWLFNMSVMPPVQAQRTATVRGLGNHCRVWVEDSSWNAGQVDSAKVAFIVEHFDHRSVRDSTRGVWQLNTDAFGMPPDTDNDSLINLMYYDVGSFHGYLFDGFWMFYDEYPDSFAYPTWGYHSNEMEVVYIDDYPNNPGTDYRVAIVAHEFEHMIHYNYDQVEELWVNEGCAELAMWLYGSPDPISEFNTTPDNDLTDWTGSWGDYIQTYLYFLYLYEQYGERVGNPLIKTIVANQWMSTGGIDSSFAQLGLPETFLGSFQDWVIANYMRDTITYGGHFGYFGEHVPAFSWMGNYTTYPVSQSNGVNRYAALYARFRNGYNLDLGFDGADNGRFKAQVIEKDTINHTFVLDSISLDSVQAGNILIPGFGTTYQEVILAPTNINPVAGRTLFHYTASVTGIEENSTPHPVAAGLVARTEHDNLVLNYAVGFGGTVKLRLYAASGRVAATAEARTRPGINALSLNIAQIPAGAYFLTAEQGSRRDIAKVAIVK